MRSNLIHHVRLHHVRLLPVTAALAALFLSVKVTAIWHDVQTMPREIASLSLAHAQAASPSQPAPASVSPPPADAAPPSQEQGLDPVLPSRGFTASEIEVLQQLARRREVLEERAAALDRREALLTLAERRLDEKLQQLETLQASLEQLIRTHDAEREAQLMSLVRIYENMKPKDAARIFGDLEITTLLPVAERMKERKLAPILAQMPPSRAKQVTEELSQRHGSLEAVATGQPITP